MRDTLTSNYKIETVDLIALFIIVSGIYVITTKNPIISILYLVGLFAGVAVYLIFTGLNFIGLSYLVIYIGAISVLFLFILMLINIRISELQNNNRNSLLLGLITIVILSYSIFQTLPYNIAI